MESKTDRVTQEQVVVARSVRKQAGEPEDQGRSQEDEHDQEQGKVKYSLTNVDSGACIQASLAGNKAVGEVMKQVDWIDKKLNMEVTNKKDMDVCGMEKLMVNGKVAQMVELFEPEVAKLEEMEVDSSEMRFMEQETVEMDVSLEQEEDREPVVQHRLRKVLVPKRRGRKKAENMSVFRIDDLFTRGVQRPGVGQKVEQSGFKRKVVEDMVEKWNRVAKRHKEE